MISRGCKSNILRKKTFKNYFEIFVKCIDFGVIIRLNVSLLFGLQWIFTRAFRCFIYYVPRTSTEY